MLSMAEGGSWQLAKDSPKQYGGHWAALRPMTEAWQGIYKVYEKTE
jgi:hypothetical protein